MMKQLLTAAVVTGSTMVNAAAPFAMRDVKLLDSPFRENCERHATFLLTLDPDRLMHNMHTGCGMAAKGPIYGGWERTGLAGHSLGHYLSAVSLHYAATGDARFKQRADYIVSEMARCQAMYGTGYIGAMAQNKERKALEALKAGDVESINHCWAPWYTQHKIIAGLLDACTLTGNPQARDVAIGFAKWADDLTKGLTEQQCQRMLSMEFGGIGESFENLHKLTKDPAHLALARRFRHKWLLDGLAAGRDNLPGKHANTQIPKIVAEAADYEATGDAYGRKIAETFFDIVIGSHTYATGGNSDREHFFPPETAHQRMGPASVETCNVYNMLKLTRHLIGWSPTHTVYVDYYEQALYNQILPSQDPEKAQFAYFMSFKPGGFHVYSTPYDSFWCCYGTGLENHAKYNDSIYFHDDENLYVNLFIPSVLTWKEKGLVLTQTTDYPKQGKVSLRFDAAPVSAVALNVRCPGWAAGNVVFTLNGKVVAEGRPGTCAKLEATWKRGDTLEMTIPLGLRYQPLLGGHDEYVAFFYGPCLLAGDFGLVPEYASRLYLHSQLDLQNAECQRVPVLEARGMDEVMENLKPLGGEDRAFTLTGVTRPEETVTLRPFNRMPYNYYNVYWHVLTPAQWAARKQALAEEEARRKAFEARVVDQVTFGEQQPETDHALKGEKTRTGAFNQRTWRDAADGGWFEFRMKVAPGQPQVLMCTYWGDDFGREFEILVDGTVIASQKLDHNAPGRFFDVTYPLPMALPEGKETITVRLESKKGTIVGGLFGCAVLRADEDMNLSAMILPVPASAKFSDPDYYIWGGSIVRGDDGKCHLLYSRWPRKLGHNGWVTHSEIAHAVADSPMGEFRHRDVALPVRGAEHWDGLCTHNPTVHHFGDKYYLYYMGNTGDGKAMHGLNWTHRNNQRIGVAVADSPDGPWLRMDKPLIDVGADEAPDALMTSNPSVASGPGGTYLMVYKAVGKQTPLPFGGPVVHMVATSTSPTGPFVKHPTPVFTKEGVHFAAEDPYIWYDASRYRAIVKDNGGHFTGKGKSTALFESADGLDWKLARHPLVATTEIEWEGGKKQKLNSLERPQLYFENGRPAVLLFACDEDSRRAYSYNIRVPLKAGQ